jgi:hypothetical protein
LADRKKSRTKQTWWPLCDELNASTGGDKTNAALQESSHLRAEKENGSGVFLQAQTIRGNPDTRPLVSFVENLFKGKIVAGLVEQPQATDTAV